MHLSEVSKRYPAIESAITRIIEEDGIGELYEPQEKAIEAGLLDGENMTIAIPTASGKTLIAELAMLSKVQQGYKAIYLAPLRALASEKYEELKKKHGKLVNIGISTSDLDSSGSDLDKFDIIIMTNEKMDSIMRHHPSWIGKIGIVVLDEVHLIDSANRGPTLEIVATKLMALNPQFLALSATIENSEEIAKWLNSKLVESSFRPVKLSKGVYFNNTISFSGKSDQKLEAGNSPSISLAIDIINKEAQGLIFVSTRRSAEAESEKQSKKIVHLLKTKEKKELERIADRILNVLESPTKQCIRLSTIVRGGAAFHHAGLHNTQRKIIEDSFKSNLIKTICSTPTLAAGVNLPGKRVIIRDYKRYGTFGMEPIPVLEVHQMFGRAGRPKYDTEGEAVLIASSQDEFDELWEHYIEGRPEPISSKLGVAPVLRMHTLGLIAESPRSKEKLVEFYNKTFYAFQYSDVSHLETILSEILDDLFEWGFIEDDADGNLRCTRLGLRVAQLYLDPLTAFEIIQMLSENKISVELMLTMLCNAAEMRPLGAIRRSEEEEIYSAMDSLEIEDGLERAFKQAYIFEKWMDEIHDDVLYDKYAMSPGVLRGKLNIMDWLLYASSEISRITSKDRHSHQVLTLRRRLKYGVKKELLPLVSVRGIGRVRARKIYTAGIKDKIGLKKAGVEKLSSLIGKKTAEKILTVLDKDDY